MTTLHSALSFPFASAEAMRAALAERGAEEAVSAQLRQAEQQGKLAVGTVITARYQYKVGADGALLPTQTRITTTAPDEQPAYRRGQRPGTRQEAADRQPSFQDLSRPKAELSPTEELALFAAVSESAAPELAAAAPAPAMAEVTDEQGRVVEAQILTPGDAPETAAPPAALNIAARAQFFAANLYARNNDVVYNVTPITQFAA